jgi:hypothetical protein
MSITNKNNKEQTELTKISNITEQTTSTEQIKTTEQEQIKTTEQEQINNQIKTYTISSIYYKFKIIIIIIIILYLTYLIFFNKNLQNVLHVTKDAAVVVGQSFTVAISYIGTVARLSSPILKVAIKNPEPTFIGGIVIYALFSGFTPFILIITAAVTAIYIFRKLKTLIFGNA